MTRGSKVAIGCLAAVVLAVLGTGVGGYVWFQSNKDRLKAVGDDAKAAGMAYAEDHSRAECEIEAFRRLDADSGMIGEIFAKIFFRACLDHCDVDEEERDFCEDVPPRSEILKSVAFSLTRCTEAGRGDSQPCTRLVQEIQEHCHQKPNTGQ